MRRRVRRKRRSRRSRRAWWIVVPVLAGLLGLAAIAGVLLLRDVTAVRSALMASQDHLREVQASIGEAELDRATEQLRAADEELGVARSRSGGPLWRVAGSLPVAREPIAVVRGVVDVATAATALADVAVREGGALLTDGLELRVVDGVVDLDPLTDAAQLIDGLPLDALRTAADRLAATDPGRSPAEVVDARLSTLELAQETLEIIDRGDALLSALPGFLGAEQPRRYLLGVQTSGELRATGGLIGFYAVLSVDDGAFSIGSVDVYEGLDDEVGATAEDRVLTGPIGQLSGPRDEAADAPPWFTARYAHTEATSRFSNVNVDPDLPTTARIALDLYQLRTGDRLDGLVLIDPIGLQAVLEATGSDVPLPPDLAEPVGLVDRLPAGDFARFVTVDIYDTFGSGFGAERKQLLAEVGSAAFAEVFSGPWDGIAVARAIAESVGGRHLQVFSEDPDEQAAFVEVDAAGAFAPPPAVGDRLAVIANNAVGGKQDVHLGHRIDVEVELSAPRQTDAGPVAARRTTVRTTLVNPLTPTAFDEYIVGNCLVDEARNQCFEGPAGWNRTWFSVWTPGDDQLQSSRQAQGPAALVAGSAHGQRVFDRYEEVGPESEGWFELVLDGPVRLSTRGEDPVFTWSFWRQAKAIPDVLDVTLTLPVGWEPVEVELAGVGDVSWLTGVDAEVAPATVAVEGRQVRLTGAIARDTSLHVQLRREG